MKYFATILLTICGVLTGPAISRADNIIVNPISAFEVFVDGQFTGGVINGDIIGEWSDVTPAAFISPADNNGQLRSTFLGDPAANSLLYAAIAPGALAQGVGDLYLMYDYLPRTQLFDQEGEFVFDVTFPIHLPNSEASETLITVQIRNGTPISPAATEIPSSFFDVFIDLNQDGIPDGTPESLGLDIAAAAGFGPSALSPINHLLVELEVSLRIPAEFGTPGGPFPGGGINPETGLYDPDPKFWGSFGANDLLDPPASAAIFSINPDGSVVVTPAAVPEPGTLVMLLGALVPVATVVWRRRRISATGPAIVA